MDSRQIPLAILGGAEGTSARCSVPVGTQPPPPGAAPWLAVGRPTSWGIDCSSPASHLEQMREQSVSNPHAESAPFLKPAVQPPLTRCASNLRPGAQDKRSRSVVPLHVISGTGDSLLLTLSGPLPAAGETHTLSSSSECPPSPVERTNSYQEGDLKT